LRSKIIYFSAFLGIILIFASGSVTESFAIDYVDSTGYTPSWAPGNGYHTVLVKCGQYSGDGSSDSYWCLEWMAYVLDQGIENFPQSTSETSSTTFSTTEKDPNDLVKGDLYFGPLTKYLPPNSFYEKTWDGSLDWKPNEDDAGWIIGKPYFVSQGNAESEAGLVDHVLQGIFVPDRVENNNVITLVMVYEFDNNVNAGNFFEIAKAGFLEKMESDKLMEDVSGRGTVYYDDCIAFEKNFDMPDESAGFVCIRDKYLVSTLSVQNGGYVTDNFFEYVLPGEVADDISREIGKKIDVEYQQAIDSKTGSTTIYDQKSCINFISGATWNPTTNSCVVKSLNIEKGEIFTVGKGIVLINSNGNFKNSGTFNVLGVVDNWGTFENYGTINVSWSMSANENKIINKGIITINDGGGLVVMSDGILENYGTITNNDDLINFGEIKNFCEGEILGNPIGNDFGTGKEPIKQIPCETISEKTSEITSTPSETKATPSSNIVTQEKTESSEKSIGEAGVNATGIVFAIFIVIVIPAIIMGSIILKIKKRLPQGMFKKMILGAIIFFIVLVILGASFASMR
jgi:hypothetical protein